MSSSIFSSENLAGYWRLPSRTKAWHGLVVLVLAIIYSSGPECREAARSLIRPKITAVRSSGLYREDATLGYSLVPGAHEFAFRREDTGEHWEFRAVIASDGHRRTSADYDTSAGDRPEIWVFGDSQTWGWMLNDAQTYPWLLQEQLPQYTVRNLACNGYSTVHALLQIRQAAQEGKHLPAIALIAFYSDNHVRNVADERYITSFRVNTKGVYTTYTYPRATDKEGTLHVDMVPVRQKQAHYSPEYCRQISCRVFEAIREECDRHEIRPVVALQAPDRLIARHCRELGFVVVELDVDLCQRAYNCRPFDGHPNAAANRCWAEMLTAHLAEQGLTHLARKTSPRAEGATLAK